MEPVKEFESATRRPIRGRAAPSNPAGRYESIAYQRDEDWDDTDQPSPKTQFFRDSSSSLITYNKSPDVGFEASINPYRGCEHGCMYYLIPPRCKNPIGP